MVFSQVIIELLDGLRVLGAVLTNPVCIKGPEDMPVVLF